MPKTKFFTFRQNNSGGNFVHDEKRGIGYAVCVEARDKKDACHLAEDIGLYFNGCDSGIDCSCCGDRWSDWVDGEKTPGLYGQPIKGSWGIPSYVHYLDGRVVAFDEEGKEIET